MNDHSTSSKRPSHPPPPQDAEAPSKSLKTSAIPGFRHLSPADRRRCIADFIGIDPQEVERALGEGGLDIATADQMIENALGTLALPFGIALNIQVNGRDYLVPMAIEEPSVIAAASHAAKRVRAAGGFSASADPPWMIAQVETHDVPDPHEATDRIASAETELLAIANAAVPGLVHRGGGARRISVRDLGGGMVVTHLHVDCRDAMGANLLNTVAEAAGSRIAEITGGELGLRILSNYCDDRCVRVIARLPVEQFGDRLTSGPEAARGVAQASLFAERDPYRAATHNKGIMNGIDAVILATGNDWRAVEAGAHAFAARNGRYGPLATWKLVDEGRILEGRIELPLAVGIVGGALRAHRGARLALSLLHVKSASELAMVAAATGLATNLAALRALATEGIQRGHMALHHRVSPSNIPPRP